MSEPLAVKQITQVAIALGKLFEGVALYEADEELDRARRIAWRTIWIGESADTIFDETDENDRVRRAVAIFHNIGAIELDELILETRLALWMHTLKGASDTKFGKAYILHKFGLSQDGTVN